MNRENSEEMLPEYDMRGAVRGKFLAHAQRWAGITTATGPLVLQTMSTGQSLTAKIVELASPHVLASNNRLHITLQSSGDITSEVLTRST